MDIWQVIAIFISPVFVGFNLHCRKRLQYSYDFLWANQQKADIQIVNIHTAVWKG